MADELGIVIVKENGEIRGVQIGFRNPKYKPGSTDKGEAYPFKYGNAYLGVNILRELAKGDNLANFMAKLETAGELALAVPKPEKAAKRYEYE